MDKKLAQEIQDDVIYEWCEDTADKTEEWAKQRKQEDKELGMLLNRVCDACCDVMDELASKRVGEK